MKHIFSYRKPISWMIVLLGLALGLGRQAWAKQSDEARSTVSVLQSLIDGCGRDDPFAPLVVEPRRTQPPEEVNGPPGPKDQEVGLPSLCLHGIVWSHKLPLAIVNNSVVGVGDKVEGRTIVSIARDEVALEIEGKRESLKIQTPTFGLTTRRVLPKE